MNAVEGFCQRTGEGEILLRDNGGDRSVLQAIPPSGTAPQTVNRTVVDYGAAQGWESCLARLPELSCAVKDEMGSALGIAQVGGNAPTAKTWKGLGPGVLEVVASHDGNAYRAVYRSPSGIRTA